MVTYQLAVPIHSLPHSQSVQLRWPAQTNFNTSFTDSLVILFKDARICPKYKIDCPQWACRELGAGPLLYVLATERTSKLFFHTRPFDHHMRVSWFIHYNCCTNQCFIIIIWVDRVPMLSVDYGLEKKTHYLKLSSINKSFTQSINQPIGTSNCYIVGPLK